MMRIDAFAHVFLPQFADTMRTIHPSLEQDMPFLSIPALGDVTIRRLALPAGVRQIISMVNVNPEDYVDSALASELTQYANEELAETVRTNPGLFYGGVAMICANNIDASGRIIEQIARQKAAGDNTMLGIQIFTRHLGQSIADPAFVALFQACSQYQIPMWLHPVFDERKPENNTVFSWEYELSQAMMQIVQAGYFTKYPDLRILVHHAGAMVPYFYERITHILGVDLASQFKRFYVDTALIGNTPALELAYSFYGADRLIFGTDAPFAVSPAGATTEVINAIENLQVSEEDKRRIFQRNLENFLT